MINDEYLRSNIEVNAYIIILWLDEAKFVGKDETEMLRIINNMKNTYYKTLLSKALVYYITG